MRNFIRNIINRLRGLIYGDTRETIGESVVGDTIPLLDERAPGIVPGRFATVALTPAGILFEGIRYDSSALGEMLFYSRSGERAKVTIKWDPSDTSSIYVWNSTARPHPQWVTVATAGAPMNLSFSEHELLRDFAEIQGFAFITEAGRSKALELLREHSEKLANLPPVRENRQARRDVDPCDGPLHGDGPLTSRDPQTEITPFAADEKSPRRRKPSKAAVAKAKRTKTRKKAEIAATPTPRLPDTERK